jgi:hypothetical protein
MEVEDGEKRVRWYKRKLETLFYVFKFLPQFMDSALSCPYVGTFLPKEDGYSNSEGIAKHSGCVCWGVGSLSPNPSSRLCS